LAIKEIQLAKSSGYFDILYIINMIDANLSRLLIIPICTPQQAYKINEPQMQIEEINPPNHI